jgi:CspA family cold shock protein
MYKGKIKSIDRENGFGFIEAEDGQRVFFHQRWLRKTKFRDLNQGDEVVFDIDQGPRGPRAFHMMLASDAGREEVRVRAVDTLFKD